MRKVKKAPSGPFDLLVTFVWNIVSFATGFGVVEVLMRGWDFSSVLFGGAMLLFLYISLTMYYFRHFHDRIVRWCETTAFRWRKKRLTKHPDKM